MNEKTKIALVGGDRRQIFTGAALAGRGFSCEGFALAEYGGLPRAASVEECVDGAACVVLGAPFSRDGKMVNMSGDSALSLSALCEMTDRRALIAGGGFTPEAAALAARYGIRTRDYLASDETKILNAVPTAEGAIAAAIGELERTLWRAEAAVLGCGKVARALIPRLRSLGAKVTVGARRAADRAWCQSEGCDARDFGDAGLFARKEIVFNTVPAQVVSKKELDVLPDGAVVIDLASGRGGVDAEAARERGVRLIRALSLPGKVAPATAGRIIAQALFGIFGEEGIAP